MRRQPRSYHFPRVHLPLPTQALRPWSHLETPCQVLDGLNHPDTHRFPTLAHPWPGTPQNTSFQPTSRTCQPRPQVESSSSSILFPGSVLRPSPTQVHPLMICLLLQRQPHPPPSLGPTTRHVPCGSSQFGEAGIVGPLMPLNTPESLGDPWVGEG